MENPKALSPVVKYGGGFIALLLSAAIVASFFQASPKVAVAAPVTKGEPALPEPAAAPSVPVPSHNYLMEDAGEYGYERPPSQDDINAGKTTNPLLMIRYLGQREDGSYTAAMRDGEMRTTVSCKDPCNYIRVAETYGGQPVGTPSVLPAGNNLATAIMLDAMAGYLKPYNEKARVANAE